MKCKQLMIFLGVVFLLPGVIYAHGVRGKVDAGGVVVTARYDSGEPMSYAKVNIFAPGAKLSFQSGRADRNGRFCFFPDVAGDWKVIVDDEIGHRLEIFVPVDETMELQANQQPGESAGSSCGRYQKALMGISVIFGIFGIFFWWKGRAILSSSSRS
jgi:nickel transport protein